MLSNLSQELESTISDAITSELAQMASRMIARRVNAGTSTRSNPGRPQELSMSEEDPFDQLFEM